jgi:hypothetical protein
MTEPNVTTVSINLSELSLEQLVQLSQGLGRKIDALRDQRAYLAGKIAERVAKGERTSTDPAVAGEAQTITAADVGVLDASAPGALIDVAAG